MSFQSTFLPSMLHTRWKLMRPLSVLCSMLKWISFSRTAVNSRTGIVTNPKLIEPFQIAWAMSSQSPFFSPNSHRHRTCAPSHSARNRTYARQTSVRFALAKVGGNAKEATRGAILQQAVGFVFRLVAQHGAAHPVRKTRARKALAARHDQDLDVRCLPRSHGIRALLARIRASRETRAQEARDEGIHQERASRRISPQSLAARGGLR